MGRSTRSRNSRRSTASRARPRWSRNSTISSPSIAALIEASPFVALATSGPEGLDCSPRGDVAGFVRIADPRTLMMPDRRGNNRADSLKNIIRDPRVGLLFLVPGSGTTLRVNGRAHITAPIAALCESFAMEGKPARSVMVIAIDSVYFQCARAIHRSDLWNPERHVDPASLPTPGKILAATSKAADRRRGLRPRMAGARAAVDVVGARSLADAGFTGP